MFTASVMEKIRNGFHKPRTLLSPIIWYDCRYDTIDACVVLPK